MVDCRDFVVNQLLTVNPHVSRRGYCAHVVLLRHVLLYVHLIGFALLLGGTITQYLTGKYKINQAMLAGAGTQVITGLILAAPFGRAVDPPPGKLITKALLGVIIFAMVFFSRQRENVNKGHFLAIAGLTLITAAVAVFWR